MVIAAGGLALARLAWQQYSVTDAGDFISRLPNPLKGEPSHYLGVLGDTGLSAYFGLRDVGRPGAGDTVLVSAAAGAVGSIAGQVQTSEGATVEAEAFYRQTILNALREVNNSLTATVRNREAYDAQYRRVEALREYARLAFLRFENGAASYLEVLYANNELFTGELAAVDARIAHYTALIDVYKSIGGGWVDEAVAMSPTIDEVMSRE